MKFAAAALLAVACAGCISDERREQFVTWRTRQADRAYRIREANGGRLPFYTYQPGDITKAAGTVGAIAAKCAYDSYRDRTR